MPRMSTGNWMSASTLDKDRVWNTGATVMLSYETGTRMIPRSCVNALFDDVSANLSVDGEIATVRLEGHSVTC